MQYFVLTNVIFQEKENSINSGGSRMKLFKAKKKTLYFILRKDKSVKKI